jgi:hypothetical protein
MLEAAHLGGCKNFARVVKCQALGIFGNDAFHLLHLKRLSIIQRLTVRTNSGRSRSIVTRCIKACKPLLKVKYLETSEYEFRVR